MKAPVLRAEANTPDKAKGPNEPQHASAAPRNPFIFPRSSWGLWGPGAPLKTWSSCRFVLVSGWRSPTFTRAPGGLAGHTSTKPPHRRAHSAVGPEQAPTSVHNRADGQGWSRVYSQGDSCRAPPRLLQEGLVWHARIEMKDAPAILQDKGILYGVSAFWGVP